jgi:hypothetical protein
MEGRDKTNKGAEDEKDWKKLKKSENKQQTSPPIRPSNKKEQGSCATPMDGEIRDDNTPMQEAEGDAEMTPSEVGTEDPDLRDLVEREGIDLRTYTGAMEKTGSRQCTNRAT